MFILFLLVPLARDAASCHLQRCGTLVRRRFMTVLIRKYKNYGTAFRERRAQGDVVGASGRCGPLSLRYQLTTHVLLTHSEQPTL